MTLLNSAELDIFMAASPKETTSQLVIRHLGNGAVILRERGSVALFGAAMREVAKLVDSPVGVFLAPKDIRRDGPGLVRSQGMAATVGAVFRQLAATYDPPLGRNANPINDPVRANAPRYHFTYELTLRDGVVPARRPVNDTDFALAVPFEHPVPVVATARVAAVIHAFYPDVIDTLLSRLTHVPGSVDLFISTDTDAKRIDLRTRTANWTRGSVEIRVFPNRGRDIAAKFVGFRDVYQRYELFIHLHTKRSPHGGTPLARWRDYLVDNLLGSPEIARSILSLFNDRKVGIVFPQHLFEIRGILNWGYDYDFARDLMHRMGVEIDKNLVLEFPSGSMFWGRSEAIRPLLELGLTFDDFPEESGQVDGTVAHAIERIVLMTVESRGYEWLKVVQPELYPLKNTVLAVRSPPDVAQHRLRVFQPCLTVADTDQPPFARTVREARPITTYPSRNERPRLTLIVPTINPQQTFGGIATAMKLLRDWLGAFDGAVDGRIVVTDATIDDDGYKAVADFTPVPFVASADGDERILVDARERGGGRLDLRDREIIIATAWWTAENAVTIERDRARYHGGRRPMVYLIQDDEPYFYGWGAKWARAEATYLSARDGIAIINSEELYRAITAKYAFAHSFCLPYVPNEHIAAALTPRPRERLILVYGRPVVSRNAFELICEAILLWQQRDPIRASLWRIAFLGETFEAPLAYPLQNFSIEGKVTLEAYADYLNRASIGISLMISPHPSYPPLEMAEAGLRTITNSYVGKDLRCRFPDIVSLDVLRPSDISAAIEDAIILTEPHIGQLGSRAIAAAVPNPGPVADAALIVNLLRDALA